MKLKSKYTHFNVSIHVVLTYTYYIAYLNLTANILYAYTFQKKWYFSETVFVSIISLKFV